MFVYPEYGIATVNDMAVPVDRPIEMHITASSVMNSLYIPELAGMIYAMPSMETKLHGVANETVESEGFSSNYSGAGFSGMRFKFHAVDAAAFEQWIEKARASDLKLTRAEYIELEKPSEKEPPRHFALADDSLFHDILNRCVQPGKTCMDQMMAAGAGSEHHEHH
jgi:cytochrome o ubiquinol oxidase subunit 2